MSVEKWIARIIEDLVQKTDFATVEKLPFLISKISNLKMLNLSRIDFCSRNFSDEKQKGCSFKGKSKTFQYSIIGITGTGGAGKSSLT
jgi:hypothetical protein